MFHKLIVFFVLLAFSINVNARLITLSGKITNLDSRNINTIVRVYNPGFPFLDTDASNEFKALAQTSYDALTGNYTIEVNVADSAQKLLISASYRDENTEITNLIDLGAESNITHDITLPNKGASTLSFRFRFFNDDNEYDYANSYSCMVVSDMSAVIGRIMLFSFYDAGILPNEFYDLPSGNYIFACSIKNIDTINPPVLRKFMSITLPLLDANDDALPPSQRIINFIYNGSSSNTTSY